MAAIAGYVLGESWTTPAIAEITVSEAEDLVYVRKADGVGFDGVQSLTDLRNNWNRLLDAADADAGRTTRGRAVVQPARRRSPGNTDLTGFRCTLRPGSEQPAPA